VLLAVGITFITFALTDLVPGNPALANLGQDPTQSQIHTFDQHNGVNEPFFEQFGLYMSHLLHGDLGSSQQTGDPVTHDLGQVIPATAELAVLSILLALVFGIAFGLAGALWRDRPIDHVLRIFSLIGVSVPTFWLALVALYVLFYQLGVVPGGTRLSPDLVAPHDVTGMYTVDALLEGNLTVFWNALEHLILPAVILATANLGLLTRYTRSAVLEVMDQDYIRAARAKGLPARSIVFRHILRAALPSIVTVIGLAFANVMTGAVLVEDIFSWPGLGQYGYLSAIHLDLPAIAGVSLFIAGVYVTVNFIVDILYGLLDPRIRVA
jgi:peptide/nickel transport system permease protein